MCALSPITPYLVYGQVHLVKVPGLHELRIHLLVNGHCACTYIHRQAQLGAHVLIRCHTRQIHKGHPGAQKLSEPKDNIILLNASTLRRRWSYFGRKYTPRPANSGWYSLTAQKQAARSSQRLTRGGRRTGSSKPRLIGRDKHAKKNR